MTIKILFVCLGNICRSPAAEAIFLKIINDLDIKDQFYIESAGTGPWHVGNSADYRMRQAAKRKGIEMNGVARQISLEDFQKFDFILTMDNQNLSDVNSLALQSSQPKSAIIKPILEYSLQDQYTEIPDPYYGGPNGFETVIELLEDACNGIISDLNLPN